MSAARSPTIGLSQVRRPRLSSAPSSRSTRRSCIRCARTGFVGVSFFGGGALLVAATAMQDVGTSRFTLLAVATTVYVVAVLLLTMAWHVPRNNALVRVPVATATDDDVARAPRPLRGSV